jgi:hypothetical protein
MRKNIWKTVIDFTKIKKEGIAARKLLEKIHTVHGANSKIS